MPFRVLVGDRKLSCDSVENPEVTHSGLGLPAPRDHRTGQVLSRSKGGYRGAWATEALVGARLSCNRTELWGAA